jgi:thioredoxin-related protein
MKMPGNYFCIVLTLILMLIAGTVSAQSGKLPPFKIMQSNGKVFQAHNLPMEKPIAIIYFSPECDHCTDFLKQYFKRASDFKNVSVVMITFLAQDKVQKFVKDYKVGQYPNIVVGTEGTSFFVKNYYKVHDLPFMALHDKMGNMIKLYSKDIQLDDVLTSLGRLK